MWIIVGVDGAGSGAVHRLSESRELGEEGRGKLVGKMGGRVEYVSGRAK